MTLIKKMLALLATVSLLATSACTHVKGIALDDRTQRPFTEAQFTVGRPDGVGAYSRHNVNSQGRFDFYISPTDEDFLFVWDGHGDPLIAVQKIGRSEINDHMTVYFHKGNSEF